VIDSFVVKARKGLMGS